MLFPFTVCSCILTALSDQDLIILTSVVLNSQFDNPNIFAMSGSESLYRRKKKKIFALWYAFYIFLNNYV